MRLASSMSGGTLYISWIMHFSKFFWCFFKMLFVTEIE